MIRIIKSDQLDLTKIILNMEQRLYIEQMKDK